MEHPDHFDDLPNFLAVDRALGITGAWDIFHKLKWEYAQFRELSEVNHSLDLEDRVSLRRPMYAAINTAATAWSLVEWIWREAQADQLVLRRLVALVGKEAAKTSRQLKDWARENDDLEACHQIAHQAKHGDMRKPNENFSTRVNMWYPKGPDGRSGWRQTGYVVWQTEDGEKESSINNVFVRVLHHWDRMLDQLQIVERMISIATAD
jgi:hypothetical protein